VTGVYIIGAMRLKRRMRDLEARLRELEPTLCPECREKYRKVMEEER